MTFDLTAVGMIIGPCVGGFIGALTPWILFCPNRGCCQMKNVHRACEGEKEPPR